MLLRLEDTDAGRASEEYAAAIEEDLTWLGLFWEGAPLRQSHMSAAHEAALDKLRREGRIYDCFCPPEKLKAERARMLREGRPPRYAGTCAKLSESEARARISAGEAAAARFRMPRGPISFDDLVRGPAHFSGADIGDFVVRRAGGGFSFFFANAVDDAETGVNLVLRGEDHLSNTPRQIAILGALGLPPPRYGHLPLMLAAGGTPLSKRDGALSVRELRARGILPDALRNYLARVGHAMADDSPLPPDDLAREFSLKAVSKAPAAFDESQLRHRQRQAAATLDDKEFARWIAPALAEFGLEDARPFRELVRDDIFDIEDARRWAALAAESESLQPDAEATEAIRKAGADFCRTAAAACEDDTTWEAFAARIAQDSGLKGRALFIPLRAALTGRTGGPLLPAVFQFLAPAGARSRLLKAATWLDAS